VGEPNSGTPSFDPFVTSQELRSYATPPETIKKVLSAVLVLLGEKKTPDWGPGPVGWQLRRALLGTGIPNFFVCLML